MTPRGIRLRRTTMRNIGYLAIVAWGMIGSWNGSIQPSLFPDPRLACAALLVFAFTLPHNDSVDPFSVPSDD